MADAKKQLPTLRSHDLYPRLPAVCEKNIFHLIRYTQPVENYPYCKSLRIICFGEIC